MPMGIIPGNHVLLFQSQLEDALSEKAAKEEQFKKEIEDLQSRLSQLDSDKEASERRQREDLAQLHRDLIGKVVFTMESELLVVGHCFTFLHIYIPHYLVAYKTRHSSNNYFLISYKYWPQLIRFLNIHLLSHNMTVI